MPHGNDTRAASAAAGRGEAVPRPGPATRRRRAPALALAALLVLAALVREWMPSDAPVATGRWLAAQGLPARYVEVAGVRLRYVRRGSGPRVVLLHTLGSSIFTWRHVLPELSREHDVIALDFPGFGGSDQPVDLQAELYPSVLAGFVARLGGERVSVVGNGLGGAMAVIFAAFRPDRVERLALLNPTGYQMKLAEQPLLLRLGASPFGMALAERTGLRRTLITLGLRQVVFDRGRVTPAVVDEYVAPLLRPGAMSSIRSVMATYPFSADQFDALARRVRVPVLVVWGRDDRWMPTRHVARYLASMGGARAELLDRCGHLPQEERPGDVALLLLEFLRAQEPASARARAHTVLQES
jgi:pimeloyl-ACP methyl ester carboxylesterase